MAKTSTNLTNLIKQHIIDKYEFVKKDIRLDEYKDTKYNKKQEHWIWWFFPTLKEGDSDTLDKTSIILTDEFIDELLTNEKHMVLWTKILNRICNKLVKHNYKNLSDFFTRDIDVVRIRSFIYIFLHVYQFKLIVVPEFRNAIIRLKRFDVSFDQGISDIMRDYAEKWIPSKKKIFYDSVKIDQSNFEKNKNVFYKYTYDKIVESVKKLYPDSDSDKQYYWIRELIEQYNFIYDYDNITSVECREQLLNRMLTVAKLELSVETTINDPTKTIYALSDIHADIQAFIISLRDCAKVIDKDDYNPNVEDPYLNYMLEKDLNTEEEQYDTSLGYRWIKPNTYVVICGDILDGARLRQDESGNLFPQKVKQEHDYLQSEIKLLMFINELNRQAIEKGSRIFKIMGNHDMENIKGTAKFIDDYNSKWITTTQEPNHYYKKLKRNIVFTYNKIGFNILMKYNLYFGLVINNNLFVHGNMSIYRGDDTVKSPKDIIEMYDTINKKINNQEYSINQWAKIIYKEVFVDKLMQLITNDINWKENCNNDKIKKIIDTIHYGTFKLTDLTELLKIKNYTIDNIANIIYNLITRYFVEIDIFKNKPSLEIYENVNHTQWYDCNDKGSEDEKGECLIKELYRSFYTWDTLWSREHIPENIDKRNDKKDWCNIIEQQLTNLDIKRLIVGHCPQSNINRIKYDNLKTLSKLQIEDAVSMKFSKEIATGSGDGSKIGQIAGITGECVIDNNDFLVYHVDIASSRAFDSSSLPTQDVEGNDRNLEIMGRTPQVLEIISDAVTAVSAVSVIKSKETNTRLHQPRKEWDEKLGKLELEKIKLLFVKFTKEGSDTDFADIKYYDKYVTNDKKNNNNKVVLTNGANEDILCSGAGTSNALRKIFNTAPNSNTFCLRENMKNIYKPNDTLFNGKKHIKKNKDPFIHKTVEYPLGSVFYENNTGNSSNIVSNYIEGCYHIRGYVISSNTDLEKEFSPIVEEYYGEILEDFAKNKRATVLHLAQSPGHTYGASPITTNAMLSAIKKFKTKYEKDISEFYRFTVIIDSNEDLYKNIEPELESEPKPIIIIPPKPKVIPPKPNVILPKPDISNNKLFLKHIYQMLLHHMLKYEQYCSKYGIESSNQLSYDYILGQMTDGSLSGGNYLDLYIKNKHNYEQFSKMYYYETYRKNKLMYDDLINN